MAGARRIARLAAVAAAALLLLGVVVVVILALRVPARPFAPTDGKYAVGVTELDWVDRTRADPFASDRRPRRLTARIWYPTTATGAPARYVPQPSEMSDRFAALLSRRIRANAVENAPIARTGAPYPVLLYSHGFQATRWSATFVTEWLASHGYVVVALEYMGPGSETKRYLDGTAVASARRLPPAQSGDAIADTKAFYTYLDGLFSIWLRDARFGIDQIAALNRAGPFRATLDLERIGAFGSSFGGALSLELAVVDPRVRAAINYDGSLFGTVARNGAPRPVMMFNHDQTGILDGVPPDLIDAARSMIRQQQALIDTARIRSARPWYDVTIAGSEHLDFSDYPLLDPFAMRAAGLTDIAIVHRIIRDRSLAFFDHSLKGAPPSSLLKARSVTVEPRASR